MGPKGNDTRQRVLDRAIRRASIEGLEGLTIGSLSSELQMSKSGLFAHFGSKEQLQIAVLEEVARRFIERVIRPAFKAPRGEARIRAVFERNLAWNEDQMFPGGCVLMAAAHELDARTGPARDFLVDQQRKFLQLVAHSATLAIEVQDFREDLNPDDFAFDVFSLILGHHYYQHLLNDPDIERRVRGSFERIIRSARRR
ncbi:MAG: TetR/AcrR family transcriptional regulator [Myxococcota bacterium]